MQLQNPCLQAGGFHEGLNEGLELLRLPLQGRDQGAALLRQVLLPQELRVQQHVGDGRFGLVGDVRNQTLDLVLFLLQVPGGDRGGSKVVGQLGLHSREQALVKARLREGPPDGLLQHALQAQHHSPRTPAAPRCQDQCRQHRQ